MLDLLDNAPSQLHSAQLGSIERFVAHQHLYNLSPPKNRVRHLEKSMQERKAAAESKESRRVRQEALAASRVKEEKEYDDDIVMLSETRPNASTATQETSADVTMDASLEAELFPELPPAAKNDGQLLKKPKAPIIDITSSEDEIELSKLVNVKAQPKKEDTTSEKENKKKAKGKEAEDKPERGRFGVWKLLSSILDAHAPGQANTALHHRSPHYGFQRGHSYK